MLRPRASMMIFTHLLVTLIVVVVVVFIIDNKVALGHSDVAEMDFETDQDRPMMLDGSAQSLAIATSSGIQCDSIKVELCKHMEYPSTIMPNFFNDLNQIDANQRARYYRALIESDCNRHISTYLCQLITPVCLDQDPDIMSRFKILPCRPFCRRMKRDCSKEILKLDRELESHLAPAFDCDQLPYELNMGNLTSADKDGPCHDPFAGQQHQQSAAPSDQQRQQPADSAAASDKSTSNSNNNNNNPYKPFDPSLDDPYITDNSRIDIFPPISGGGKQPATTTNRVVVNRPPLSGQQPPPGDEIQQQLAAGVSPGAPAASAHQGGAWAEQLSGLAQSVITNLVKFSNIISIITVLVLLAALNAKRLKRLRRHYSSTSSASSSSSSSSAPLNCGGGGGGGGPCGSIKAASGLFSTLGPTESSPTSLVGGSAGYHTALARQQQIYSNILLSSPSHQVLLLNDASQQSGARAKLMPLIGGGGGGCGVTPIGCHATGSPGSRPAPPQSRAPPVPVPAPSSSGFASSSSSDRHSTAGGGGGYYEPGAVDHQQMLSPYSSSLAANSNNNASSLISGSNHAYDSPALVGQHHYHLSSSESLRRPAGFQQQQQQHQQRRPQNCKLFM